MDLDAFKNQRILITGATGSLGKALVKRIVTNFPTLDRLVIFSRDELKQFEMSNEFSQKDHKYIRYFIGDIRDYQRLEQALDGIEIVIHAAALKQVYAAEYNPFEFIKTNVLGTQNLVQAAIKNQVKKVIALSTDKAVAPINLYGASKLCADKLILSGNNISGSSQTNFSVVRYGNVLGSRGSVVPLFQNAAKYNLLKITDPSMTRFNILMEQGVNVVLNSILCAVGGETFVPKLSSYRIMDLANAIAPDAEKEIIGIRHGEKLHEEMISNSDTSNVIELDTFFVVLPPPFDTNRERIIDNFRGTLKPPGFSYSSESNEHFLSIEELKGLLKTL